MKRLMLCLALASPAALANSEPCPPGEALSLMKADAYTAAVSNAERIRTASKVANDAIQRCIALLTQFKLGISVQFPSPEALSAAAINVVVDRACQEVYRQINTQIVKYDPKGYVTTGRTFDVEAIFGEWLEKRFPNESTKLVNDILRESERDIQAGGIITVGEFLKKAGADPRSVARANQVTESWLKSYVPRRVEGSSFAPAAPAANTPSTPAAPSFWR